MYEHKLRQMCDVLTQVDKVSGREYHAQGL